MSTVHFIYNKGPRLKTPERILYEIAERLGRRYRLETYDMSEPGVVCPQPGDVLIGHPTRYYPSSLFNRSFDQSGWARRIVFCPFSHAMPRDAAAIDSLVEHADLYLALCGPYWIDTMGHSLLSHWGYKTMRCGLGVNQTDYPRIKNKMNPPGKRRFLYIGNAGPMKGVRYFYDLAKANANIEFGWIGWIGDQQRPWGTLRCEYGPTERCLLSGAVKVHGGADWRKDTSIVTGYDFLLTCGRSDSNPTTILESVAWGLIPVATPQCGYYPSDWMATIPLDDIAGASKILARLNSAPETELEAMRAAGRRAINEEHTWDNIADQVIACIEAPQPIEPTDPAWLKRKMRNQKQLARILRRYRLASAIEDRGYALAARARRIPARIARVMKNCRDSLIIPQVPR